MESMHLSRYVPLPRAKLKWQEKPLGCDFQAYSDKAPIQIPMLKLKHHSAFFWEEGSIEQRGFTKEEMLSLQLIEAVTKKAAWLFGIVYLADKIADAHIYRQTREEKDSRGIFLKDAAVDVSEAEMGIKSKLTCGLCELDPTVSIKNSERSWDNLSALLKHQHSGFHASKLRNVHDTIQSHVTEQDLTIEKTGGNSKTTGTVPQQLVGFKNTDVSSKGRAENGTDKRNLKPPKPSKDDDAWSTRFRDPEYTNEVERPTFSFSEVITDRCMEQNRMPQENNEECNSAVPSSYAYSKCLEQVPTDQEFLSSLEQGKTFYPIHELDRNIFGDSAPRSSTGEFVEPNLINFEDSTSETRSKEDCQDPWMLFRETGGTLLDSV
ncbi:uncharacterized protein EAE97_008673 [Botrytis byssoidea]|uniref:Uncharacterized protein n=1 Tax=Botrytis byssoidea TaxID=139641 RepID=A0A9P5M0P0_9HELO|nr:uncharacterized protein EAE97_008673 [Botrytis byssoidea]KAF7934313.1 hypothetical protein EAE97_008673 [Botrytis byssoidea]